MKVSSHLNGLRLLVVEDEALIAMMIEDVICDAGAIVVGPVATVRSAMSMLGSEPIDGAILDVNLGGQQVDPVADLLCAREIPFLFLSGYGESGICQRFPGATMVSKPFNDVQFVETVRRLLGPKEPVLD